MPHTARGLSLWVFELTRPFGLNGRAGKEGPTPRQRPEFRHTLSPVRGEGAATVIALGRSAGETAGVNVSGSGRPAGAPTPARLPGDEAGHATLLTGDSVYVRPMQGGTQAALLRTRP